MPRNTSHKPKTSLSSFAHNHWHRTSWLSILLRPLAKLAGWHIERRRAAYQSGKRKAYRAPVPVIIVGNIYVGGTGKTPVVIATVQALKERGWTPGVISRGYGVKIGADARVGQGDIDPYNVGDEPALIAHATRAPISVHPRRALAVQALLNAYPQTDVIISDDGLQHLNLARDIEFVVQDERGVGNGQLLPAGPLREPPSRLDTVDVIITNQAHHAPPSPTTEHGSTGPKRVSMHLMPDSVQHTTSNETRSLADFSDTSLFGTVAAVAGIGNPTRFFDTLRAAGIHATPCVPLPDHYTYQQSPFTDITAQAILITSKDAIKCRRFNDSRLWEVAVRAQFSDPALFDWLDHRLRTLQN